MAKGQRRKQGRRKTFMSTAELIEEMEAHLPIPTYACEELCQFLRDQGKDVTRGTELQITKVFDSGTREALWALYSMRMVKSTLSH